MLMNPGLFSDDIKMGKTILNDYKLSFDKKDNGNHSMTYTLKSVISHWWRCNICRR